MKRIEELTHDDVLEIDSFVDIVQTANFDAITESHSIGDASAIIVNAALRLAYGLEFGVWQEDDEEEGK